MAEFNRIFSQVKEFIDNLSEKEAAKVRAQIDVVIAGDYESVYAKKLKGPIWELIVGQYRFVFFLKNKCIYFVSAFRKKTNKTPKYEIENAEKWYKEIT